MTTKMTKRQAVKMAFNERDNWAGGAAVIVTDDGYDAIPGAYLDDASYTGSRTILLTAQDVARLTQGDLRYLRS